MALEDLLVKIRASASEWSADMKKIQRDGKELEKSLKPMTQAVANVGKAMTGVGVAVSAVGVPFGVLAKRAIDAADELDDMAERTGASVEVLSALALQADLASTSMSAVESAMRLTSRVMEDAATGSKSAAESLNKIGLSAEALLAMNPDSRFFEVAKGLAAIEDPSLRAATAMEIWGRSGTELFPMLEAVAAGQDSVMHSAQAMGRVMTTEGAQAAENFNKSIINLQNALMGMFNTLATSGLLESLAKMINILATGTAEFAKAHPQIVAFGAALGAASFILGPLLAGLGLLLSGLAGLVPVAIGLSTAVGGTAGLTAALSAVVAVLTGPIGIAVAIITATALLHKFVMENETLVAILDPAWNAIGGLINTTVDFIKNIWSAMWDFIISAPQRAKDAILGSVRSITEGVTGFFKDMYDKVVGQSFVPDMIDGIQDEFRRLVEVMLNPTRRSTFGVQSSFSSMFQNIIHMARNWKQTLINIVGEIGGRLAGKALGSIIGGASGGAIGTLNPATGALAGGGAGGMAGLAAFATNPFTIGAAAAGVAAIAWIKSQAHHEAKRFTETFQNPFHRQLEGILHTGSSATEKLAAVANVWKEFSDVANQFATQGKDEALVVRQAFETLTPIINQIKADLNQDIAGARPVGGNTGPFTTILQIDGRTIARIISQHQYALTRQERFQIVGAT